MTEEKETKSCDIHNIKAKDFKNGYILGSVIAFGLMIWIFFGEQIGSMPVLSFFSISSLSTAENTILLVVWFIIGLFIINTIIIIVIKNHKKKNCLKQQKRSEI